MTKIKPGAWIRFLKAAGLGVTGALINGAVRFAFVFACLAALTLTAPHLLSDADFGVAASWAFSITAIYLLITCAAFAVILRRQLLGYVFFGRIPRVKNVRGRRVLSETLDNAAALAAVAIVMVIHLPWGWQTVGVVALVTVTVALAVWLIFLPADRKRRNRQPAAAAEVLDGGMNDQAQ